MTEDERALAGRPLTAVGAQRPRRTPSVLRGWGSALRLRAGRAAPRPGLHRHRRGAGGGATTWSGGSCTTMGERSGAACPCPHEGPGGTHIGMIENIDDRPRQDDRSGEPPARPAQPTQHRPHVHRGRRTGLESRPRGGRRRGAGGGGHRDRDGADARGEAVQCLEQESTGPNRSHEDSGLGLALVGPLGTEMGGSVEVDTEKGVGTCFTVRLPRNDSAADESGEQRVVRIA